MRALPFPCYRPASEGALGAPATSSELQGLVADGMYLHDGSPSFFVCRISGAGAVQTLLLAICPVGDLEAAAPLPGDEGEPAAHAVCERICALGCQDLPVELAYPDEPVLELILGAATMGAPAYRFSWNDGSASLGIWEVKRRDTIDSVKVMLERMDVPRAVDGPRLAGALLAARRLRRETTAAGTVTGREPFNWALVALAPESQAAAPVPGLPAGLILHQVRTLGAKPDAA